MHGHIEEDARLRDYGDVFASPVFVEVGKVLIIEPDHAFLEIIHTEEQLGDGRLSRSRGTNDESCLI